MLISRQRKCFHEKLNGCVENQIIVRTKKIKLENTFFNKNILGKFTKKINETTCKDPCVQFLLHFTFRGI